MADMSEIEKAFEENKGLRDVMFLLKAMNTNLMLCSKAVEDFDGLSQSGKELFGGSILNLGTMYIASLTTIGVLATKLQDKPDTIQAKEVEPTEEALAKIEKDWKKLSLN